MTVCWLSPRCAASTPRCPGRSPAPGSMRCGMGPSRVATWLPELVRAGPAAIVVAGVAGALDPSLRPGDVIVANEVRDAHGRAVLRAGGPLAADLRRMGLRVRVGPIVSTDHLVNSVRERDRLAATGALAADMESAAIARAATKQLSGTPIAVVRVIVDTVASPVNRLATVPAGIKALRVLRRTGPALQRWADLAGPRRVVLGSPRAFCAGVERAIDIVELALQRYPRPVYVRRQIVHNQHVVADLERQGAVFVDELDDVPDDTTVVFSAHGVAPAVREEAARRKLNVIDATCPLVGKVHAEARRFAGRGDTVLLVGHAGHDETEGTLGEVPGRIHLVQNADEAERIAVADPDKVAVLLQTTLAVDEAEQTVERAAQTIPAHRVVGDRRHLLRDHQPAERGDRDRRRVRRRHRARLAELVQLEAVGRGGTTRRCRGAPGRRRVATTARVAARAGRRSA